MTEMDARWSGARNLLRHVRDIMASDQSAQIRLDKIVQTISHEMVTDVCSIYVRRAGDVLELFSTEGLKETAVHHTRLRVGEGIVGEIAANAAPMSVADVTNHPSFAYRPETGEESFNAMAGVPIMRGGRLMGVLVIQSHNMQDYGSEELETLETISMVIAEMIAAGGIVRRHEQTPSDGIGLKPLRLDGIKLASGLAMGRAVLHRPFVQIQKMVADNVEVELSRLDQALSSMLSQLDSMMERHAKDGTGDHIEILETYRMFAQDRGWIKKIQEAIKTGLTAEAAIIRVQNETRTRLSRVQDPIIREKLMDLEDLTHRLLQHLGLEGRQSHITENLPHNSILIARNMGPAELLDYDKNCIKAVVLEEGSSTAHVAIVARALGIPVVGQIKNIINRIEPFDRVIVDGNNGACFVRPGEDFRRMFEKSMELHAEKLAEYKKTRDLPSVTKDGLDISLQMNAGLLIDLPHLHESGAEGIGLYRTEVPFMARSSYPDVETQTNLYRKIFHQLNGKHVTFRTLDVGGDKALPYFQDQEEENPAMGWRAIRIAMDRPVMLRQQIRAMLIASEGRPFSIMFPMIAEVDEFIRARQLYDREYETLHGKKHILSDQVKVGAMLEVPALAFQLDAILKAVDFLSIGSNDLHQFLFASDRGNPRMDGRYDPLSPAMLNFLKMITDRAKGFDVELSVCGEMAGTPLDAMALIGVGITKLSMSPPSLGPVRTMVRSLDSSILTPFLDRIRAGKSHSLRNDLAAFARDHGIRI